MARKLAVLALLTGLFAGTAGAAELASVLGNDGDLYRLRAMTYGQAVAGAPETAADDPVLVLEMARPGQAPELSIVPWTEGPEAEGSVYLAFEQRSDTLFITWEKWSNFLHSRILLVGFHDGEWSEVIPVSDVRFSLKSSPRLAISHDSFDLAVEGDPSTTRSVGRTVLHMVWLEERTEGAAVVYSPVLLLDGGYVGHHEYFTLSHLFNPEPTGEPMASVDVRLAPAVESTADSHAIHVGFVDPVTHDLVTLRVSLLSGQLSSISGSLRSHILDVGAQYDPQRPEDLGRLAGDLRSHILDVGARGDRDLLEYVAGDLRSHILDVGASYEPQDPEDLQRMAADLRSHILDVGFRLDTRGLPDRRIERSSVTLDVVTAETAGGEPGSAINDVAQVVRIEEIARRPLPELPDGVSTLLISGNGEHALIAWTHEDSLDYRETSREGWSEVFSLHFSDEGMNREDAIRMLEQRAARR